MHDDTPHRCRLCGEVSTDPDEDMVKIGIRHWKHFKRRNFGQMYKPSRGTPTSFRGVVGRSPDRAQMGEGGRGGR